MPLRSLHRTLLTGPAAAAGPQFVRFVVAGIANTVFGFLVFWIANQGLGWHIALANAAGYALSLVLAYLLNRFFVFSDQIAVKGSVALFLACFAAAFVVNQAVLWGVDALSGWHPGIVQLIAMASYTLVFFLLNKLVVFAGHPADRPLPEGPADGGADS
ncbi:GtrA family protein [Aquisalinus flavus]|uniref:GtrA/DPMS transmembrane domain-containing protein n=1 Tax=Aquisalinus flavus TaxID=1526572 RepID=A0A8J2V5P6_9PROT|nr:GtrA family protein [Aquisalinus flavus]MBD0426242.1 GtrA family protein [Aquisalinus flavus]UNE48186.1 GtrA family protein [Aquisalinus flavus]GGD09493.1 hypothetical protein GCM10011342_17950 [Aquisalinus flavus]